jgi:hypothetical protein
MRRQTASALLVALPFLAACGSTEPDEEELARGNADAAAALMARMNLPLSIALFSGSTSTGPYSADVTVPCPSGGTIKLVQQGSRTSTQAGRTDVTWSLTLSYAACRMGSGAQLVTLDGSLTGNGTASWQVPVQSYAQLLALNLTQSGTLEWTIGSSTGSCAISLTTTKSADLLRTTGTMCGQPVDEILRLVA